MNMKEYAFGIDLGGTTAKVGLFTTAGALLEKWEVPTDTSNAGEHILGNLAKAVKDKMQENGITAEQVEGVGIGVPGPVLDSSIVPIVCANLGGSATMCGDPPNIIIGTSLGYTFGEFISNTGFIALISLVVIVIYFYLCFHKELAGQGAFQILS